MTTLVLTGHHIEEAFFGELVAKELEKDSSDLLIYPVVNGYRNGGRGTREEIRAAHDEVWAKMQKVNPAITINLHTGLGDSAWWDAELFTVWEYDKLAQLERANTEQFPVVNGGVYVRSNYPRDAENCPLLMQNRFPFVTLETYLCPEETPPFQDKVKLATQVVREIGDLYNK